MSPSGTKTVPRRLIAALMGLKTPGVEDFGPLGKIFEHEDSLPIIYQNASKDDGGTTSAACPP
jgi:hypothetical protein